MGKLPARCELARWAPVSNFGYGGRKLDAQAFVVHSAEGHGDPPGRFSDGSSASAHFWNKADGTLLQLVELTECAWANGIGYNADGSPGLYARTDRAVGAPPIVKGWYSHQQNPNWFTVSMEHEGFKGEPLTAAQLANTEAVARWLEAHGLLLNSGNLLLHSDISATACPSGRVPTLTVLAAIHAPAAPTPPAAASLEARVAKLEADHAALNNAVLARDRAMADAFGHLAEGAVVAHSAAMAAANPAKVPGS